VTGPSRARIPKSGASPSPAIGLRLQRKCGCDSGGAAHCEDCRSKRLERRASGEWGGGDAPPIVHEVLRSPGQPLPEATRGQFESRFAGVDAPSATLSTGRTDALTVSDPGDAGEREADRMAERTRTDSRAPRREGRGFDFSRVRIHTDARAAASAQAVAARAYTVGQSIVFAPGQFAPSTDSGRELLAHELAHTTQQAPRLSRAPDPARDRKLPPHVSKAPSLRSAAAGTTPCSTTGCPTKIPGSAEDFIPGGSRGEGGAGGTERSSIHVKAFAQAEAPQFLSDVHDVVVVPGKGMEQRRISWGDCPKAPADDPSAACILISQTIEQQAAVFNQGKAPTIAGVSREDWSFQIRRQLSWASDQVRFRRSPTAGLPANDAGAMWELQALHGWLAGWPVDYERAMQAATPDEQEANVQKYIDFRVENQTLGVRGILRRLRCTLSCAEVDESITKVFGEVSSGWPREMRDALLFGLMDPKRRLDWPPRPRTPQSMTFPAEPRPKMPPLYAPRTGFESEAGKSGENL
jgi:hypothetical protein